MPRRYTTAVTASDLFCSCCGSDQEYRECTCPTVGERAVTDADYGTTFTTDEIAEIMCVPSWSPKWRLRQELEWRVSPDRLAEIREQAMYEACEAINNHYGLDIVA